MEKLQRLKAEQSRGGRGYPNEYQNDGSMQTRYASNPAPPAPYGRSIGLRDVIAQARDLRNPQSSTQSSPRDDPYSGGRNFPARGSSAGQRDNHGLLTPIAKLMKKVEFSRTLGDKSHILTLDIESALSGYCQHAIGG